MYPVTIIQDRYSGSYSKGAWTAWNKKRHCVPEEIDGGDVECQTFWADMRKSPGDEIVGLGDTPQEAYDDLFKKWKAKNMKRGL